MVALIDDQLRAVQTEHPGEEIGYLILSGGLGSSPYVQTRLRDRYERGVGAGFTNAAKMSVLIAPEPQLAVVNGLVQARVQALRGGPEILSFRRCPVSFGIACRELWNAQLHQGEDVQLDPHDRKRWAENQIFWFVKQDQVVDATQGINHRFRYKIPLGRERDPWHTRVVMSTMSARNLPKSLKHDGVKVVCKVETVLDQDDMKRMNHKWYHLRKEYKLAEFDVKMLVGTGLSFEVWGKQGRKSKSHEEIDVEWQTADDSVVMGSPAQSHGFSIYRA